ncbi:MAG: disulfide oxidoreductase [Magnetovibrio sp.]|nr:disulfide oxidoreductase [Magnetovibrio sp.]
MAKYNGLKSEITALLGPTNTGKTYFAMQKMLSLESGTIGFPLRLLARENYEHAVRIKGKSRVALITGEEKIVPKQAQWFICTVEAMPTQRTVDFLAVDEIQMCADKERGHIFTERLLYARGNKVTMFMGSDIIQCLLKRLIPSIKIVQRPRLSTLSYIGKRKITGLPPRSAIVSFSAPNVYELAELVRRQRGGAAIVMGALSPRTRNAQVGMYQAGEVDYLVATDAIGMGLNMDIRHIAFAELSKFDGWCNRNLSSIELAQAAGRAGRYMCHGSFGTTGKCEPIDSKVVKSIEEHRFSPVNRIYWRNPYLDFSSLGNLLKSLQIPPSKEGLVRSYNVEDELVFTYLIRDHSIQKKANNHNTIRLLWDVCQIPDFRKQTIEAHAFLLKIVFTKLTGVHRRIPNSWFAEQVSRLDRVDGNIETLMQRISYIRTWTYISHRPKWLSEASHWQERVRAVENRLSDALHERLTQRFVNRHHAFLVSRIMENKDLVVSVCNDGSVMAEGHNIGAIEGFSFQPKDIALSGNTARIIFNASKKAIRREFHRRIQLLEADKDDAFSIGGFSSGDPTRMIFWREFPVAKLEKSSTLLLPKVRILPIELLNSRESARIQCRLESWLKDFLDSNFSALKHPLSRGLRHSARGLMFQITEGLGSVLREKAEAQIENLSIQDREILGKCGVRFGQHNVFFPVLLKPKATMLRGLLWSIFFDQGKIPQLPPVRGVSILIDQKTPSDFYHSIGFFPIGPLAIRADIANRFLEKVKLLEKNNATKVNPRLFSFLGAKGNALAGALSALGCSIDLLSKNKAHYNKEWIASCISNKKGPKNRGKFWPKQKTRGNLEKNNRYDPNSPFFKLQRIYNLGEESEKLKSEQG